MFPIDFKELRNQRPEFYKTRTIDLSVDRSGSPVEWVIAGNYVYVLESTDGNTVCPLIFNEQSGKQIRMIRGRAVRTPFYRLWIANEAQSGKTITFGLGISDEDYFKVEDSGNVQVDGAIQDYGSEPASRLQTLGSLSNAAGGVEPATASRYSAIGILNNGTDRNVFLTRAYGRSKTADRTLELFLAHYSSIANYPWGSGPYFNKNREDGTTQRDATCVQEAHTDSTLGNWRAGRFTTVAGDNGFEFIRETPVKIYPGYVCGINCKDQNTELEAWFEFYEYDR